MTKTLLIIAIVFVLCFAFPKIAAAAVATVSALFLLAAFGIINISVKIADKYWNETNKQQCKKQLSQEISGGQA